MKIENLTAQHRIDPIGMDTAVPVLNYRLSSDKQGDGQTAFEIYAASSEELLEKDRPDLWNSGKISGEQQFSIPYGGKPLASRQKMFWKVRVWDQNEIRSDWSPAASYETGLLSEEDWKGKWIGQGDACGKDRNAAPAFAGEFTLKDRKSVARARLYISGLGIFIANINGRPVSDELYAPGESEYNRRVFYETYDVLSLLREGKNVLGVILGNGQYSNFAVAPVMKYADDTLCDTHRYQKYDTIFLKNGICGEKKLIAQLEITRTDGTVEMLLKSDESWRVTKSAWTFQNWYGGEDYDGRYAKEHQSWDLPGTDRSSWLRAVPAEKPLGTLHAREYLPVRITERWKPVSVRPLPGNKWLVDMGKNSAGFTCLKLKNMHAFAGAKIELLPGEIVNAQGSGVDQASSSQSCNTLFSCEVKDCYTVAGLEEETWHPMFCYHGFQYVEVRGFPGTPTADNFEGCAVRVCNEKYSDFETDNEILNRINQITDRSIESNMMSSFTDCPQIEKLGWIETTHLMFASMAAGYDISSWIPKTIHDMMDAQVTKEVLELGELERDPEKYPGFDFGKFPNRETEEIGFVPGITPEYFRIGKLFRDPNWGGACVMTPWYYYREFGDLSVLKETYPMMKGYLLHLEHQLKNDVLADYAEMGEWGQLNENTPTTLVATCAFYLMADIAGKTAELLNRLKDAAYYQNLKTRLQEGFYGCPECFCPEDHRYGNGSQASIGCSLFSGIIRQEERKQAEEALAKSVADNAYHLNSGEVGLKQVFYALAAAGRSDIVYRMVMNPTQPSYRHHVDQGLTTLPEYWNYTELWNGVGRSRNHAMMGHVKEWLFSFVLGIHSSDTAFRSLQIRPFLNEEIHSVNGSVQTVRGKVSVCCRQTPEGSRMTVQIPVGASADVCLPLNEAAFSGNPTVNGPMLESAVTENGYVILRNVPSGRYSWNW